MQQATREMLAQIDTMLARCDVAAGELWEVLTALRGPDLPDNSGALKESTTAHIRREALPRLCIALSESGSRFWKDGPGHRYPSMDASLNFRSVPMWSSDHFDRHVQAAAEILGIVKGEG